MKNSDRLIPENDEQGYFVTVRDGLKIFVYEYSPNSDFKRTVYVISGITGINHKNENDIIELLSNGETRVVVIHPRGTGYSEGERGDLPDINDLITDYAEIIKTDRRYADSTRKIILYGHSMSCAIAMKVAGEMDRTGGLILVNPPCKLKSAKGMSPGYWDYIRYIGYYIFAPHVPVVNMAGDPTLIQNESDRRESEIRSNDPLLVKYFSMRSMTQSKKIINAMIENAGQADYPLLLLYGDIDLIVDKTGCDELYSAWKSLNKKYEIITGGSHGKSTVFKGAEIILKWMDGI